MPDAPKSGRLTIIPKWLTDSASRMTGNALVPSARREPWFGPGEPMRPVAPPQDVAGRAFDFPNRVNTGTQTRQYEGPSFFMLRGLADSLDIVRLAIETRKDQMGALTWAVLPRQDAGEASRKPADDRCRQVQRFLERPDRRHSWDAWLRMLLEDQLVIDAASVYVRKNVAGEVYSLEVIDGSTVRPLLDKTGRMPEAPAPAYQQILKGMPAIDYTEDELFYAVRNPRPHTIYGLSNVQQIMMTINIAVRREIVKLQYFSSGNIPEAFISVPPDWTPDQISKFQVMWDSIMSDTAARAGAKFVPGNMIIQQTRSDGMLMGPFDEWIARVVCYAFSLPPTAFVQQMNRATAEQSRDTALEEGLAPMMVWFKCLMDRIIQEAFGYADLEFVFDDIHNIDIAEERARELSEMEAGLISMDEIRAKRGLDPVGMGPAIWGANNGQPLFIDDLLRAKAQGLTQIQPPMDPNQAGTDELGSPIPPMPTYPPDSGLTADDNGFAGIPADLLAQVGLGPDGHLARAHDITQADAEATDPLNASASPQVLAVLREAEARQRGSE